MLHRVVAGLALSACGSLAAAQTTVHQHGVPASGNADRRIEARHADRALRIDGVLNDDEWRDAEVIDAFTQQEPSEGAPATERTEVRVLYDARYFYIGVNAFDTNPAGTIATEMRRDSPRLLDEDNFQVILDTFRDSRSGYMFVTNPLGAKLEQQVFEEGGGSARGAVSNINRDWDGVWDVAARRTTEGWTAEIAIPLVTLRSPDVASQTWGVNFMRNIRRKNEQVFWAPIPKPYTVTRVSLAGTVTGMTSITRGLDLRIKPFLVAGGRRDRLGSAAVGQGLREIGLDVKYGIASGVALDLTVNTDFAQVEVDEQQVNLTRFQLFFPEKREFFLENAGQFTISAQGTDRLLDLFYSRRIGLSDSGQPVPIIGGARVTGKIGRDNIAMMDLQTQGAFGQPGENVLVARYSRDLFRRSKVGGLVINKETKGSGSYNRTVAADALLTPHKSVTVRSFLARTATPGRSGQDQAFHTRADWLDTKWNIYGEFTDIQENFNPEVGFVPRTGIRTSKLHLERNPRNIGFARVLEPMINVTYTTDQHNRLVTRRIHQMLGVRLQNGGSIVVYYNHWLDVLDRSWEIRKPITVPAGVYRFGEWNFSYSSNPSRRFYQSARFAPQTFYGGTRTDSSATLGVRVTNRASTEFSIQRNDVDLPWGGFLVNLGILRIDYALSPRMTLRALSQYNSSTRQLSTSARFNFIYKPGSDLYVVYDELQGNMPGQLDVRNRQLVVKMTYLMTR
ncbi:MAG: DUF5916 domain-containing protein [Vicinamibacterales bacterium]